MTEPIESALHDKKTTCQVCGREIKANTGLIAHHGYRRPYDGWQTASCEGARYVSYEVSCERLREVAAMMFDFIVGQEKALENFLANPPQVITVALRRSAWGETKEVIYMKPDDFKVDSYRGSIPRTYENAYRNTEDGFERTITLAKADLKTMQRRLDERKPL